MADNDAIRGPWMDYNRRYLDSEWLNLRIAVFIWREQLTREFHRVAVLDR